MDMLLTLRYIGTQLVPQSVTDSLGVLPTSSRARGDLVVSSRGKERIVKRGYWEWEVSDENFDFDTSKENEVFSTQLDKLVTNFYGAFSDVFSLLSSQLECELSWIDIYISTDETNTSKSFALSPKSMNTLSKTGLSVEFTVDIITT